MRFTTLILILAGCASSPEAPPTELHETTGVPGEDLLFRDRTLVLDSWLAGTGLRSPREPLDLERLATQDGVERWNPPDLSGTSGGPPRGLLFMPDTPPDDFESRFAVVVEGPPRFGVFHARMFGAAGGIAVWVDGELGPRSVLAARDMLGHRFGLRDGQVGLVSTGVADFSAPLPSGEAGAPMRETAAPLASPFAFAAFLEGTTPVFQELVAADCPLYLDGAFHDEEVEAFHRQCHELRRRLSFLEVEVLGLPRDMRLQFLLAFVETALDQTLLPERLVTRTRTVAGVPFRIRVLTRVPDKVDATLDEAFAWFEELHATQPLEAALDGLADTLRFTSLDPVLIHAGHDVVIAVGPPPSYEAWTTDPGGLQEGTAPVIELRDAALVGRTGHEDVIRAAVIQPSAQTAAELAEEVLATPWSEARAWLEALPTGEAWIQTGSPRSGTWHHFPVNDPPR